MIPTAEKIPSPKVLTILINDVKVTMLMKQDTIMLSGMLSLAKGMSGRESLQELFMRYYANGPKG